MAYKLNHLRHPSGLPLEIVKAKDTGLWVTPGGYHHQTRKAAVLAMEKLAKRAGYIKKSMIGV